jgi:hypothetical protein
MVSMQSVHDDRGVDAWNDILIQNNRQLLLRRSPPLQQRSQQRRSRRHGGCIAAQRISPEKAIIQDRPRTAMKNADLPLAASLGFEAAEDVDGCSTSSSAESHNTGL